MNSRLKKDGKLDAEAISSLALMGALMFASKVVLASLPNIHIIAVLIIVGAVFFGRYIFFSVAVYILLEGLFYGFGLWWLCYWYVWPLLVAAALFFRKNGSAFLWAVIAAMHGLLFGALSSIPYLFIAGRETAVSIWVAGIPFDLLHGVGNFILTLVLYKPLYKVLSAITGLDPQGMAALCYHSQPPRT